MAERWTYSRNFIADPLVSALVFVYGAERFMRGLLEDLEAQTIADRLEIVVVDTGSPTAEGAIIREFQERYPNIAYLRTDTRETTTSACNRCVAAARGRYVTLACADDRHRPDAFERMVAVLEAHPDVALVYGDVAVTTRENERVGTPHVVGHFRWPEFDPRLLFQVCYVGPQPMYRRTLHLRYEGYDPEFVAAGDYEFWLRVVAAGERFQHIPEVLGLYLWSPQSNEHANQAASSAESERARLRHWPAGWGDRPPPGGQFLVPIGETERPRRGPLVTVVVPTRDRPEWLRRALESVARQTYPEVEVVVVNDGGVDVEGVVTAVDRGGQMTYVRRPRSGERSAARNLGIHLARGAYVAFLDDDDWYDPEHLAILVQALEASGAAVAYTDARRVIEERQQSTWVPRAVDRPYSFDFNADALLVRNYIPICCLLMRREALEQAGRFDETLATHEDWDLLIRLSRRHGFVHVPQITCAFSWREDGSSTSSRAQADFQRTAAVILRRYADEPANPEVAAWRRQLLDEAPASDTDARFTCSIILPVFNKVELTRDCLTALAQVTTGPTFEVIVVDNASTDETPAFLATLGGDVRVVRNRENLGFARACNQGARAARGRYLVFLNNDTIPFEGWLSALVGEVDAHPEVAVVGAKLLYRDGTIQHAGVAFSRHHWTPYHVYRGFSRNDPAVDRRREFQAVTGACMLVRRDVFEAVGEFDEGFRNGFEDVDLCLRVRARGGRVVYQPRSVLYHLEGQTPGRHDHEAANGQRLYARWAHTWLVDEDAVYVEDGYALVSCREGDAARQQLESLTRVPDPERWRALAELERRAQAADVATVQAMLAAPDTWPDDSVVLAWAAGLCERAGLADVASTLRRRLAADPAASRGAAAGTVPA